MSFKKKNRKSLLLVIIKNKSVKSVNIIYTHRLHTNIQYNEKRSREIKFNIILKYRENERIDKDNLEL